MIFTFEHIVEAREITEAKAVGFLGALAAMIIGAAKGLGKSKVRKEDVNSLLLDTGSDLTEEEIDCVIKELDSLGALEV